ncbi:MAG: fibronectin type III domain-containing protein, partial [Xanthomonadales bacterium]|nr:fibronectin type III domain-containing protein [Xanthomonadales bacterium]
MKNPGLRLEALAVTVVLSLSLTAIASSLYAQSGESAGFQVFGPGQPASVVDLPAGQLKDRLLSLPPQARENGLNWLRDISFTNADLDTLRLDDSGGLYFADHLLPGKGQADAAEGLVTEDAPQSTLDDAFLLHSRPGAPNVVYIDFDGHNITGTAWNSGGNTLFAKAYDLDGDPNSFNDTERTKIVDIWHRVAEDLAPFDIDVTTEEPAVFNRYTGRILVTEDRDETGANMPSAGAGGVAYVGVFGISNYHTYYSPALVYFDNLGGGHETYVAEASSHEFGHNLGLSHDGTTGGTTYYAGHGSGLVSWAPIMGNSYYNNVTQWSKGEYAGANQTQDDIAIITGRLGLKPDDHGDSVGSASPLHVAPDGSVVSSNPELDPHNELPENKGIINSETDTDVFIFTAGAGLVELEVRPAWDAFYRATTRRGANLDIYVELQDVSGGYITSSDPGNDTRANISANLAAGTYHLLVTGVGNATTPYSDYDSLGQYFINGTVPVGTPDTTPPTPNPMTWASPPASNGETEIVMTATVATDETSTVQYNFQCVAGGSGCANSGWQASNNHVATGLAPETSYTYTVVARDLAGNQTASSNPESATTDAPPPPPPYVDFFADGETAVAGSVSGGYADTHTDNGTAQSIQERESGGRPSNRYSYLEHRWSFNVSSGMSVTVFGNAWSSGSSDGDTFDFEYSLNGGGSWSHLFNVSSTSSANDQSAEVPGAPSGTILIRVVDTDQTQGNRNRDTVYVDHLYLQVANPPSDPPDGGPTGLNATAVSSSQIDLTWIDGASNETGYLVERSPNGSSGWIEVGNLPANSESFSDSGLAASTTYYFRVSAFNPNGSSAYATDNATTDAPPPPPVAPTGLAANGVSASQIDLSWSHSGSNEDGFRVERSDAG